MIVGIFAEGRGDQAVITNILKGKLNIDRSDIRYELPEYEFDQTDLHTMPAGQHSSWTVVKKVCQERQKLAMFFDSPIEQNAFVVLHLDAAERYRDDYNVKEPVKNDSSDIKEYCALLRANVIDKINEWLTNSFTGKIAYAIAVEETDAWIFTIYDNGQKDTATHQKPKERLNTELNRILKPNEKSMLNAKTFEKYDWLSADFRKKKKLLVCADKNESLKLFCKSLEAFRGAE